MWLIDTESLALVFHANVPAKSYVILSHTWEDDEVSFQDFQDIDFARTRRGFTKIQTTCQFARERQYRYAWVDTCCIDKTSSADLTENINAMFLYYQSSAFCFAYLSDLPSLTPEQRAEEENWWSDYERCANGYDQFAAPSTAEFLPHCRWFTRGWTLQELIAPKYVEFYDCEWQFRGSKRSWRGSVAEITGIDYEVLSGSTPLDSVPVATRLSWAALRKTSRHEDSAYCLLGLFGVYMPLIYGETDNAFLRLQEEISKSTNDLSIFAWEALPNDAQENRGIFARSVAEFKHCSNLKRVPNAHRSDREFRITNKGVRFEQRLTPSFVPAFMYEMDLECQLDDSSFLGIFLAKVEETYVRVRPHDLVKKARRATRQWVGNPFYVKKAISPSYGILLKSMMNHIVELSLVFDSDSVTILGVEPHADWHPVQRTFCTILFGEDNFTSYWHLQVKNQEVVSSKGENQFGDGLFQCLVACRIDFKSDRLENIASYHVWSQQDRGWNDLLSNGPADDGWRDYRFSPPLMNSRQSTGTMSPSIEQVEYCILQDSRHKNQKRIATYYSSASRTDIRLLIMESNLWSKDPPRRCTLALSIEETQHECSLPSRQVTRNGAKDVETHKGDNDDASGEETRDAEDEKTEDVGNEKTEDVNDSSEKAIPTG